MSEQAYTGGCHCGAVRYRASVDIDRGIACNCSRCSKLGWILSFAPTEKFELLSGADQLTEYRFNRNVIAHLFCRTCGIESFARGVPPGGTGEMVAVNVRCLDGVDPAALTPRQVDGRSF